MTDAAVAADPGPAPAGAPINEAPASHTEPLGSQIPPGAEAKVEPAPKAATLDDSIDRAIAKSAAKQAEPKEPAKVEAKVEPVKEAPARGEGGKFAAKEPATPAADARVADQPVKAAESVKPSHTAEDAPARFTETAKAKWAAADPEIRGETLRMQKELTDGYQKHKAAAERDASLAEFHEMATKSGTDVKTALSKYTALESLLRQDPIKGLHEVCNNMGLSLRDVAAHIMGQTPEQNASQSDATIRELRQQNSTLEARLNKLEGGFQKQQENSTLTEINTFASQPEHSRFEELADAITEELKHGYSLSDAYSRAERLNPAPASLAKEELPAASSAAIDPPVHPDKGQRSINGAPSSGLTNQRKKGGPVPSIDESLDRAFGRTG